MNELELSKASTDAVELINSYSDKLQEEQLEALPLIAYGMSISKVAKHTGLQEAKIRRWANTDPIFRQAVMDLRAVKNDYHRMMLDQASIMAWDEIFDILASGEDEKVRADMAKFIVGQLSLKTDKREIQHKVEPQLNVTEDSADLIARKLKELQDGKDTIDAEYRIASSEEVVDAEVGMATAKAVDEYQGEDFDGEFEAMKSKQNSNYVMHPECTYGKLDYNEKNRKFRCHMCGAWTKDLVVHIRTEHKLSPSRYRTMYGLSDDVKFYVEVPEEATEEDIQEFNEGVDGDPV